MKTILQYLESLEGVAEEVAGSYDRNTPDKFFVRERFKKSACMNHIKLVRALRFATNQFDQLANRKSPLDEQAAREMGLKSLGMFEEILGLRKPTEGKNG